MKQNLLFNRASAIGKRLAMVLTMLLIVGVGQAWGATDTFTCSTPSNATSPITGTSDGGYFTVSHSKAEASNWYDSNAAHWRVYQGATVTITPKSGVKITKIEMTVTSDSYPASRLGCPWEGESDQPVVLTATAQCRPKKITVTYEEASADPYTVTFHTTATAETPLTEASAGDGVTPPSMEQECGDWTFQGWSESSSNSETSTTKLDLVTLDEGIYYPAADVDLYPVYTKTEGEGGTVTWDKITTAPTDWSGEYLIVNSNFAMTSDFYSGTSGEFKGASVTVSNNQVTSSPSDKMIWIVEKNGSSAQYSFKNKSTGTYAKITGTSSTNAALSSSVIWFTISSSSTSGVWKINSVDNSARCFAYYSTNKTFRTYANSSNTTGSLYKKEGSGSTTYYYSYPQCITETLVSVLPKITNF